MKVLKEFDMSVWFGVGLGAGLFVGAIILLLKKKFGKKCEYDERQVAVRGKAFKAGFITFVICEFSAFLFELITEAPLVIVAPGIASIIIILISVFVFLEVAIFGDAYFSANEPYSPKWGVIMLLFGILTVIQGLMADESWYKCLYLSLGAFFLLTMISIFIKAFITKKALEKDSANEN